MILTLQIATVKIFPVSSSGGFFVTKNEMNAKNLYFSMAGPNRVLSMNSDANTVL